MKKGGFYGLRGKEFSLVTIGLMCVAIIILSWEKTPLLNTFPPPQTRLQLNTDTLNDPLIRSSPLERQDHTVKGQEIPRAVSHSSLSEEETLPSLSKGSPASSREAKHEEIAELKNDGSLGSQENFVGDETIHNQEVIEEGELKPEQVIVEGKIKQVVEKNYLRLEEQGVHSVLPITHNVSKRDSGDSTPILERNQACNYAKGKWVVDNKQPLYSGLRCKQWLSPMWACRLTQRTDFAYEKLRWQPKSCQMERFKGSEFLKRMQNKTLAFVGDSLGRQQFQSLMCMATGGEEQHVVDVGNEFGLILAPGDTRPSGWAYRFPSSNTTILYYWSASLCDVEPLDRKNRDTDFAMHLDRPPAFLRRYINKIDVLVLNTGHHWNRGKLKANRWVMHVGGKPNNDRKLAMIWNAKNFTIHSIVNWVNSQLPKYPGLKAFYRTISPRHFVGGDWNTGGSCDNTTPMSIGKELLQDESSDESAAGAVKGTKVKLLDITALSQLRDEAHISHYSRTAKTGVQDCLHWCLPGLPDTWNEILYSQI